MTEEQPQGRPPRILVVEDEEDLAKTIQMRLEANAFDVVVVDDGRKGLEQAQKRRPDLIVLDLMLPKVSGYEVCTMLKQDTRYQKIPVVILTAKTQDKDEQLAMECGADAFVRKPFRAEELLATIQKLLKSGSSPGPCA